MNHPDIDLILVIVAALVSMIIIMFYCFVGSVITTCFEQLADVAYRCKWFEYDMEIRNCLLILIGNYRRPMIFTGLKLVDLSLETGAMVMKTSFSYYLMFKSFS